MNGKLKAVHERTVIYCYFIVWDQDSGGGSDYRKRKYFHGREHSTVRGFSRNVWNRKMLIHQRPLNFFQGQEGDKLNKITGLFAVSGYLTPPILSSQGPALRMEWFFPREGEFRRGPPTYQPDGGLELLYNTWVITNNSTSDRLDAEKFSWNLRSIW